jgi:hypothetical protein
VAVVSLFSKIAYLIFFEVSSPIPLFLPLSFNFSEVTVPSYSNAFIHLEIVVKSISFLRFFFISFSINRKKY